jgi:hypothetical protein
MVAPMSFLERLAAGIAGNVGVRPVLPPRFASSLAKTPIPDEVSGNPAAAFRDQRAPEVEPRIEPRIPPATPQAGNLAPPLRMPHPANATPLRSSHSELAPASHSVPGAGAVVSASAAGPDLPDHREQAPLASGTPVIRPVGSENREPVAFVSATQPPLVRAAPPLREPLMREPEPSRPTVAPTEIHVTIDRIDVRAPAIPISGSPRPTASKPRAAASLSLTEYLRQPRPPR